MAGLGIRERVGNTRQTLRREVGILRGVVGDVRSRLRGRMPSQTSSRGGTLGRRGSLLKTPVTVVVDTADNIIAHSQNFARINRAMFGR